jgi:hypothetical protein
VLTTLVAACTYPSYYEDAERRFNTGRLFPSQGHYAVYHPAAVALDFRGYVLGVEMSDRSNVLPDDFVDADSLAHTGGTITRLTNELREGTNAEGLPHDEDQIPFVSHVVRYPGGAAGAPGCALYSVYQSASPELMPFCNGEARPRIEEWSRYRSGFQDGWQAIDALRAAVSEDLESGDYTHLIVVTLGWRTPQEEAIRSYNAIMRAVRLHANPDFKPIFIGVTWVGPWSGRWFDPLVEVFSYGKIANLADTLGLTWLGVVNDHIVRPLSARLSTIYISHSFGARAALTAACIGPAIRRGGTRAPRSGAPAVGRVIAFQAAFSLERFHEEPPNIVYEDVYFPDQCEGARSIVLTTSEHDVATRLIVWADLAGNHAYFTSFCDSDGGSLVTCTAVDERGEIEGAYDADKKVLYLDATKLIRFRAPGTEGGGHSDIFRAATGNLIWNLIADRP